MDILIIGENESLIKKFKQLGHTIYAFPPTEDSNPLPPHVTGHDFTSLAAFAKTHPIGLTIAAETQYLINGLADIFASQTLPFFGPKRAAARVIHHSIYAKPFMQKAQIPTSEFCLCATYQEAIDIICSKADEWKQFRIHFGCGYQDSLNSTTALELVSQRLQSRAYGDPGELILIERKFEGPRVVLSAWSDGKEMHLLNFGSNPYIHSYENLYRVFIERTQAGFDSEGIVYQGLIVFNLQLSPVGEHLISFGCCFDSSPLENYGEDFLSDIFAVFGHKALI